MSNFESNELKPDSSDRPNTQRRKSGPTIPQIKNPLANLRLSRQQLMIGIGAVILLIIILTITSSLKSNKDDVSTPGAQAIELTPRADLPGVATPTQPSTSGQQPAEPIQPQEITISPVSPTPTEAEIRPVDPNQQRIEIPGNVVDSLPQQPSDKKPTTQQLAKPKASGGSKSLDSQPAGNVTLQLSGATQFQSLNAFAEKQGLSGYWIYETRRDGKPWFVLIYGSYPNVQEANKAIKTLPADVQAKKPWVKPIRQVHQESKQR